MKEIAKSKFMIGFVVFVLGVSYINSTQMNILKENDTTNEIMYAETK